MRTLRLEGVLALDLSWWSAVCLCAIHLSSTHRAARHAVEALLALDRHIGAIRRLQLDIKRCYIIVSIHGVSCLHAVYLANLGWCGRNPC